LAAEEFIFFGFYVTNRISKR